MAAKSLGLSPHWRRKLRHWDAAIGLTEKISPESIDSQIGLLQQEITRASAMRGKQTSEPEHKADREIVPMEVELTPEHKADRESVLATRVAKLENDLSTLIQAVWSEHPANREIVLEEKLV